MHQNKGNDVAKAKLLKCLLLARIEAQRSVREEQHCRRIYANYISTESPEPNCSFVFVKDLSSRANFGAGARR
jgi:hypothetical protein